MPRHPYPPAEYRRPWKLATLALGIALLLLGARYTPAPDWDAPISLIMAAFTYLSAPWALHILLQRRWHLLPLAALAAWWSVDGCYALYWHYRNAETLAFMRSANWPASLCLYAACALIWHPRCRLCALWRHTRRSLAATGHRHQKK